MIGIFKEVCAAMDSGWSSPANRTKDPGRSGDASDTVGFSGVLKRSTNLDPKSFKELSSDPGGLAPHARYWNIGFNEGAILLCTTRALVEKYRYL